MFYLNEEWVSQDTVQAWQAMFAQHPQLQDLQSWRVAVCLTDTRHWLALLLYIRDQGGTVLPIHPDTPWEAAQRLAQRAGCNALIWQEWQNWQRVEVEQLAPAGCLLQMSSGTTGEPKCIARSWQSIAQEVAAYIQHFPEPAQMTPLLACPVSHSYGLIAGFLVALARGQQPYVLNTTNPKFVLKQMLSLSQPLLYSSPAMLHTLARLLPPGQRLHAVMSSGTLLPEPWFQLLRQRCDYLFQQYGCSEAGCIAISRDTQQASTLGLPLPHLQVQAGSPQQPQEIRVLRDEGEVATQDLGYFDEQGRLHFVARQDDTIIVAGLNVYPQEVEAVLMAMPGVEDAVVFKRPDPFSGERVCALVVGAVQWEQVRAWCQPRLAPYQIPLEVQAVMALPRQANGKINRRQLAQVYALGMQSMQEAG
ncbi:AMP-binding protein [Balneatrix alpica]|uniref:AMP-binding protein n=1 Tax=Balneatrix alpica TaxID=75684 RepID=A0ABV5Z8B0_9GAMM|nr:AMP-binding protein [Balneatrix alpica]